MRSMLLPENYIEKYSSSFLSRSDSRASLAVAKFRPAWKVRAVKAAQNPKGLALIDLGLHAINRYDSAVFIDCPSTHTAMGTARAMAQMKPANSRAMAVMTTLWFLPLAISLR